MRSNRRERDVERDEESANIRWKYVAIDEIRMKNQPISDNKYLDEHSSLP